MLSYDNIMPVNGQTPQSPMGAPGPRSTLVSSSLGPASGSLGRNEVSMSTQRPSRTHHVWLVTGPAGCGKSTVAMHIAKNMNMPYIEGDEFHPPANIAKMSNGTPLTDADRWDWLTALREESLRQISQGQDGVVLTCSALKRKYRDVIRVAPYFSPNLHLHFIFLDAPEDLLLNRVAGRQGHYMKPEMVRSQFEALERPTPDEVDVIPVDVSATLEEVQSDALAKVLDTVAREA